MSPSCLLLAGSSSCSSRILVIGGTGTMGQHLVTASLAAGHPTAVFVRPAADPSKLEHLEARGATILYGDIYEQESLLAAVKQVDVVISAVGHHGPHDLLEDGQLRIVAAIKEAGGNVKRFVPSEYGCDVEQATVGSSLVMEPARSILAAKARVREAVRAAGIPHTFVCSYWAHGFVLPRLGDPRHVVVDGRRPPTTAAKQVITVFGDDSTRAIFVHEADMSAVTVKAVDDPRTLNKILYVRPAANTCSFAHLVHLWEDIINDDDTGNDDRQLLDKYYMPEEELVARINDSPLPLNFQLAMVHATVAAGACDQAVDAAAGVEATDLYPDVNYVTVRDYLQALHAASV